MSNFKLILAAALAAAGLQASAQNPIIRDQFSADPTARVFNGKLYLFPSHDIPPASAADYPRKDWFCMEDYHVFSSENLTDWTDHGVILNQKQVPRLNFSRLSNINRLDENTLIIASLGSGVGFVDIRTDKQLFFKNIASNCNLWSSCVAKIDENSFVSGSYNGIYFAENFKQKGVFKHIFERVIIFSLLTVDDSRIAAATSNGFFILKKDSVSGLYETISVNGTADAAFYSLTKDNDGHIWAGTDHGLYRISHEGGDEYKATRFSADDGTVNIEFAKNAVCVSQDGMMYFGGLNGITYFKPKDMRKLSFGGSGVRITRFWVRNYQSILV